MFSSLTSLAMGLRLARFSRLEVAGCMPVIVVAGSLRTMRRRHGTCVFSRTSGLSCRYEYIVVVPTDLIGVFTIVMEWLS